MGVDAREKPSSAAACRESHQSSFTLTIHCITVFLNEIGKMHRKYQSFTQNCLKAPAPYVAWCAETYDTAKMSSKLCVRSAQVFLRTGQ